MLQSSIEHMLQGIPKSREEADLVIVEKGTGIVLAVREFKLSTN